MDGNKTKWHVLIPSMEDLFLFTISQLLNMDKTLKVNLGDTIIIQSCMIFYINDGQESTNTQMFTVSVYLKRFYIVICSEWEF